MLQLSSALLLRIVFFMAVPLSATAMDCRLAKSLNHPSLVNNAEFWDKLGKIRSTDERAIEALIKAHAPEALSEAVQTARVVVASTREVFSIHSKAEKARSKLSKINKKHFDDFIQVLTEKGPKGLYEQPKRWHFEKLMEGNGLHTIRLDSGNRVLFTIKDGVANILDIGNHITH